MNEEYKFDFISAEDQRQIDFYNEVIESAEKYRIDYVTDLGSGTLDKIRQEIAEEILDGFAEKLRSDRDELVVSILAKYPAEKKPDMKVGMMIAGQLVEPADQNGTKSRLSSYKERMDSLA